jgi:chemotaxis protein MotB
VGRGANQPIASNDDPIGRARNRRVAVTILSGSGAE